MNLLQREQAADIGQIVAEIGGEITWNGQTYPAIVALPAMSFDLQSGGLMSDADFIVKIQRLALPQDSTPAAFDVITYNGEIYKIASITDKPGSPWLTYTVKR